MSTALPPPLPIVSSPRPVETLAYDSRTDNWIPSVLRVFGWVALIAGGAQALAALVEAGAYVLGGTTMGRLFDGPGRFGWVWGVVRVAAWVACAVLITAGILSLARARAARVTFLVWAFTSAIFGAGQWVLATLYYLDLRSQTRFDNAIVVANSAQNFAWFVTSSIFPAIVAMFMFSPATRRWFESR
jgi:hypothetical protein